MITRMRNQMGRQLRHGTVLAAMLAVAAWLSATAQAQVESVPLESSSPSPSSSSQPSAEPTTKSLGTITLAPGENIDHPGISDDDVDSGELNANQVAYDEAAMNAYNAHDYVEARSLWEKAAKAGDGTGMFQLAGMMERGEGGDQDLDQALGWYSAAAQKGISGASDKMTALSDRMRREASAAEAANMAAEKARQDAAKKQAAADAVAKARREQQAAKQAAADAAARAQVDREAQARADADAAERPAPNPPPAVTREPQQDNAAPVTSYSQENKQPGGKQSASEPETSEKSQQMISVGDAKVGPDDAFKRGLNAAAGRGVAKNDAEAAKWFRIGADQGYAPAENNLGFMYAEGRGVKKDPVQAVIWFKKAADQNYAPAQTNLGMLYATGNGVPKDDTEALALYSSAASQNYAQGTANLAQMYAEGRGIEKDERTAQFLLSSVKEKPRQSPTIYVDSGS
jgi:uncharacterized protein